jgi:uncharacterized protein YndB with AHSA1/START domain
MPIDPRIAAIVAREPTDAAIVYVGGRWVLTLTRELGHGVDRVWSMLTEPDELRTWSPVVPSRPLTSVGPATSRETAAAEVVDAEVLVCDPPRVLSHRWGTAVLHWTLTPTEGGCRLTLEHAFGDRSVGPSAAAGWHLCLAVLVARLDGEDVERVVGRRAFDYGWQSLASAYDDAPSP